MRFVVSIFILIVAFASCNSPKQTVSTKEAMETPADTIRIANEELEYEILIIEPGFYNWLSTQYPRGYYGQEYLERKNLQWVMEWNRRVMNFQKYSPNLYQLEINYQSNIDYGYEVNYLLFNYFVYFQQTYNQDFPGSRG